MLRGDSGYFLQPAFNFVQEVACLPSARVEVSHDASKAWKGVDKNGLGLAKVGQRSRGTLGPRASERHCEGMRHSRKCPAATFADETYLLPKYTND